MRDMQEEPIVNANIHLVSQRLELFVELIVSLKVTTGVQSLSGVLSNQEYYVRKGTRSYRS